MFQVIINDKKNNVLTYLLVSQVVLTTLLFLHSLNFILKLNIMNFLFGNRGKKCVAPYLLINKNYPPLVLVNDTT